MEERAAAARIELSRLIGYGNHSEHNSLHCTAKRRFPESSFSLLLRFPLLLPDTSDPLPTSACNFINVAYLQHMLSFVLYL